MEINVKRTIRGTAEFGLAVTVIAGLILVGCGGGGASVVTAGGGSGCTSTGLTGTTYAAANGSFGTLAATGPGATAGGFTSFATQSIAYFNDPLAKIYTWADVRIVSGALATSNIKTLTITANQSDNSLNSANFEVVGAFDAGLGYAVNYATWDGTAASGVSGVSIDIANRKATFTNAAIPGFAGSAVGAALTLNGVLCLP
jgi:hypothetical protein